MIAQKPLKERQLYQVMKFLLFPNKTGEKLGVQQKKMFFPLWFNLHLFLKTTMLRPNAPFLTSGAERLSHLKS